jgi:hypothetical protein
MIEDNDLHAPDDAIYWGALAQRIHGAVLRDAALPTASRAQSVSAETGWLASRFPLASSVALAAAAVALFVVGWVRPTPGQRDVEAFWAAAFTPRVIDRAGTADGAPSIAALVMESGTPEPEAEQAATRSAP